MINSAPGWQHRKRVNPLVTWAILGLFLLQLACSTITGGTVTATPSGVIATPAVTLTVRPTEDVASGRKQPVVLPGLACFGSFGNGLTCVEKGEWVTYASADSPLGGDQIKDIDVCDDGSLAILHTFGVSTFDGKTWETYESGWGSLSAEAVACDMRGGFWVAHFQGASYFDGRGWETYDALSYLSTGPDGSDLVRDVAIAPDHTVWVVTASSVATFAGGEWTVYQEGEGFDDRYFFDSIGIDRDGHPWVTSSRGLHTFDDLFWTLHAHNGLSSAKSLAVDAQGRVWIGTFSEGVLVFDGSEWTEATVENSDLASDRTRAVVVDAGGRVWLGNEWGVHVIENGEWTTFQMHTAPLTDNDIFAIGVVGSGPESLPSIAATAPGSISGRIVDKGGTTMVGVSVELCVETLFSNFSGATPCSGQPFVRTAETDASGTFAFSDLPRGYYVLAIQVGDAWVRYVDRLGIAANRVPVQSGENTYVGEIMLGEE